MTIETGTITKIEALMAAHLTSLNLFRKAEPWNFQIWVDAGGIQSFTQYAPFAFPRYLPPTQGEREAGDLKQVFRFGILIGEESKTAGVARVAVDNLRDLVIAAFDGWHPGSTVACDPFHYSGDEEEIVSPNQYALILFFTANMITN